MLGENGSDFLKGKVSHGTHETDGTYTSYRSHSSHENQALFAHFNLFNRRFDSVAKRLVILQILAAGKIA
jgi:hypothetical protein